MSEVAASVRADDDRPPEFFAVGIAASAGGVQALSTLASAVPADLPATLLLAYHQGVPTRVTWSRSSAADAG